MKYCCHCGKEIGEDVIIYVYCGRSLGFVMSLIWEPEYPLKAKSMGQGALVGVIVSVVSSILVWIILSCLVAGCSSIYY